MMEWMWNMADNKLQQQYQRFLKAQSEHGFSVRSRKEKAQNIVNGLASLNPKDVEVVQSYVPELANLLTVTVDDLFNNTDGVADLACRVFNDIYKLLDAELGHFEEQL